jgi:glutathionyl-hydroquinone reductase
MVSGYLRSVRVMQAGFSLMFAIGGQFKRQVSSFRDTISKDGKFPPEKNRYHLVVSLACPWAHRALIVRQLKGLDKFIGQSHYQRGYGAVLNANAWVL